MVMVMVIINAEGVSRGTAYPIGGSLWWQATSAGHQQPGAHCATGSFFRAPSVVSHGIFGFAGSASTIDSSIASVVYVSLVFDSLGDQRPRKNDAWRVSCQGSLRRRF